MNEKIMTKTIVVWFGALICCALWGSAFPCIKIGYKMMNIASFDTASQILYAGCRFTLAGILALIIGSILNKKILLPKKSSYKKIAVLSIFQTVLQYMFFYIGLANTSGVKASIIEGMNVFVALILAGYIFHQEKVTSRKLIGCLIGFTGVVIVNVAGNGMDYSLKFTGEGFIFLSTVAYAFSSVIIKMYSKDENPVMLSGYQFMFGGIIMIICGSLMGGKLNGFTFVSAAMLFYLAVISAVAYSLWSMLLKYNPVSKVTVFGFMNPVFGVILSAVLLNEMGSLGIVSFIALCLVCVGIYVVNSGADSAR